MVNISFWIYLLSLRHLLSYRSFISSPPLTSATISSIVTDNITLLSGLIKALTVLATSQGKFPSVSYLSDASLTEQEETALKMFVLKEAAAFTFR